TEWNTELEGGLRHTDVDAEQLTRWWQTLNDPTLTELEEMTVAGNLDLAQAKARIREARAKRGLAETDLYPNLDVSGSASKYKSSGSTDTGLTGELYDAGFDAGWELDIFGGVQRSMEAAQGDLEAEIADLSDVLVSLTAEVGVTYIQARTYQARLQVAQGNLKIQQQTLDLALSRFEAGLSDELPVQQARYNLADTRSQLPSLRSGLASAKNRLAILTGRLPGAVHHLLESVAPIPVTPVSVAVGVPAETLRRRPDIRRMERQLAAQTARIGQTTANLYPRFRLAGSIGLEALDSVDFLDTNNGLWSIGPSISWNVFDAGAVRRNIDVQTAIQEQYLIRYETAVLEAVEEVENSLTAYAQEQLRREELAKAVAAAERAEELARDRYTAGLVDFTDVLDAQRSLLTFQDQLATSRGTVTTNLIGLYKALGGGWNSLANDTE
ncbi:MAG TPA: efflux transporter outer membrane subunit, partial [Desulfomicrobiaceae bacterium]|nr:efflux transporter outer membrane subunit [Desulfomicrobiaceae bacterium]